MSPASAARRRAASPARAGLSRYAAHGLTVATDLRLPGLDPAFRATDDVAITITGDAAGSPGPAADAGRTLARRSRGGGSGYRLTAHAEGHRLEVAGVCTAAFGPDPRSVRIRPRKGSGGAVTALVARGLVLAVRLGLHGEHLLHASAVELPAGAVAVAGPSGAGKSTLAAALCASGGRLVADDTLRWRRDPEGGVAVHRGARELRLRPDRRRWIADLAGPVRPTVDGRLAVRVPASGPRCGLSALFFPRFDPQAAVARVHRLAPADRLEALLPSVRVAGWRDPDVLREQFAGLNRLARAVAGFELTVPPQPTASGVRGAVERALEAAGADR